MNEINVANKLFVSIDVKPKETHTGTDYNYALEPIESDFDFVGIFRLI